MTLHAPHLRRRPDGASALSSTSTWTARPRCDGAAERFSSLCDNVCTSFSRYVVHSIPFVRCVVLGYVRCGAVRVMCVRDPVSVTCDIV